MFRFEPGKDRPKLGFRESVLANFEFLNDYGLACVQSDATFVRFDSPKLYVNIYHGRGSYELNVEIGRHEGPRKDSAFALDAVLGWKWAPERKLFQTEIPLFQSHTREGVQDLVPQMAALFRKYAEPLLKSDPEAIRDFDDYCTIESIRMGERERAGTVRWKGAKAFQRRDWQGVIDSYESIRMELTQVEAAELNYANQQLAVP